MDLIQKYEPSFGCNYCGTTPAAAAALFALLSPCSRRQFGTCTSCKSFVPSPPIQLAFVFIYLSSTTFFTIFFSCIPYAPSPSALRCPTGRPHAPAQHVTRFTLAPF
jgi:hypothetical protein